MEKVVKDRSSFVVVNQIGKVRHVLEMADELLKSYLI